MTKSDLISTIAAAADCSKASAEAAYDRLIDKIAGTIVAEGEADIRGLGIFKRERTPPARGATRGLARRSRSPPATR